MLKEKIENKSAVICIIGLGHIGKSIFDAFKEAGFTCVGYDIKTAPDLDVLSKADVFIISVNTTLDRHLQPDVSNIQSAANLIAKYLKKETLVILQSTSYAGTTEEIVLPALEKTSLKVGKDFFLAAAPEVLDIADHSYTFAKTPKFIGGVTEPCFEVAKLLYSKICPSIFRCSKPATAEAAKLLQNSYRLVNISFINEMKMLFDKMGLDIWEVIEAASTKPFGFTPFYPSPGAGGDCIPTVPNYLVWKSKESDRRLSIIEQSFFINQQVPHFVHEKILEGLNKQDKCAQDSKILVLGVAYKKNMDDIRESPALSLLSLLKNDGGEVHYHDPFIPEIYPSVRYPDLSFKSAPLDYSQLHTYDCIVILTDHSAFDYDTILKKSQLIVDTRNVYKGIKSEKIIKA